MGWASQFLRPIKDDSGHQPALLRKVAALLRAAQGHLGHATTPEDYRTRTKRGPEV